MSPSFKVPTEKHDMMANMPNLAIPPCIVHSYGHRHAGDAGAADDCGVARRRGAARALRRRGLPPQPRPADHTVQVRGCGFSYTACLRAQESLVWAVGCLYTRTCSRARSPPVQLTRTPPSPPAGHSATCMGRLRRPSGPRVSDSQASRPAVCRSGRPSPTRSCMCWMRARGSARPGSRVRRGWHEC